MEEKALSNSNLKQQHDYKNNNNKNEVVVIERLRCSVKNYEWGIRCGESLVGRLYAMNCGRGSRVDHEDDDQPYAELWMGSHVSGPSLVVFDGSESQERVVTLKSWLLDNPHVLGQKVLEKWGGDLPFLFKV